MSYLKFEKNQLINLEFSLKREFIRTNRSGAYGSTSVINCNTRKYHGLLVCPINNIDSNRHVLLSMVVPTVVFNKYEFNLGIHKFSGGVYEPKGHKYIEYLSIDVLPTIVYNIGGVKLAVEQILDDEDYRVLIKYTVIETPKPIVLRLKSLLAFRNVHELSKANMTANVRPETIDNGIRIKMYEGYPYLYMQINKSPDFVHMPDWYYNFEYQEEQERGYPYKEDLFSPGYFELNMRQGESIVFVAGTEPMGALKIKRRFSAIEKNRLPRINFENCLYNASQQFIEKHSKNTFLIAGFHWFDSRTRDAFIAAPGLTLPLNNYQTLIDILDTALKKINNGLFPQSLNTNKDEHEKSVDTPLWYIYAIQQLKDYIPFELLTQKYWESIKSIVENYFKGTDCNIKMTDHCLIYCGTEHYPQTWMNARYKNKPVTLRKGYVVEVNALWYNAICFAVEIAKQLNDKKFLKNWEHIPEIAKQSFINKFWISNENYLADYCTTQQQDQSIRPNQIIAASLPYSPLNNNQKTDVINCVRHKLLTKKGLRTLSPADDRYQPYFSGTHEDRERSYHNGTVHPWLLEFYCKAIVSVYGKDALPELNKIYFNFEEDMTIYGIGTINEVYDGDPPHQPRGAISQAWSVSAVLQIKMLMDKLIEHRVIK